MESERVKFVRRAGFFFLFVVIAFAIWFLFRPDPLNQAASRMVSALESGDGDALYSYCIEEERRCSNLTPDVLRKAWAILIEPRLRSSRYIRTEPAQKSMNATQATAEILYEDDKGRPWRLLMIANQAEGGPKANVLIHMLLTAPLSEAEERAPGDITLKKVRTYRAKLENVGVHRVMLNPMQCLSWDQLEAKLGNR